MYWGFRSFGLVAFRTRRVRTRYVSDSLRFGLVTLADGPVSQSSALAALAIKVLAAKVVAAISANTAALWYLAKGRG
jgi:hypothetical protein